ncbi:MAG: tetratricopeptide repeat protein, partial [Methylococcaceae bacterium]|nr:tetratricopeptide repeat protein [Methylococcaceae bacterium]
HKAEHLEHAEEVYRTLIEVEPENPNILHFFGLLRHQRGHAREGAEWIAKALELAPDYVDAENNLGNIYLQMGQPELAEPRFRKVIDLKPEFAAAHGNLGIALKDLRRFQEAVDCLLNAVYLAPEVPLHYQNLGNTYQHLRQYNQAVGMYRESLTREPFNAETYRRLSRTYYLMGEIDQCIDVVKQWLDFDPENPTALHMYAAYTSSDIPSRASDAFVRETFDGFAASFDGVLKRLDYKAPFLVRDALQQIEPDPNSWVILDAGCGTGLCGALVRPMVKHLVGVDLSPKMLERARDRGMYDELFEAELTAFFSQAKSAYHAITCVDTFCYFGDLSEAVNAAVSALKPDGWFIFTLEKHDESETEQDFRLNLHGRYSHAETYVRKTLTDAGFRVHKIDNAILRKEGEDQVLGMVVTAQLACGNAD